MSNDDKHAGHGDIGCLEAIEVLYAYLDGELDQGISMQQVEKHMAHCRSCYSRTQMERALSAHIRNLHTKEAPEHLKSRLRKLLDEF